MPAFRRIQAGEGLNFKSGIIFFFIAFLLGLRRMIMVPAGFQSFLWRSRVRRKNGTFFERKKRSSESLTSSQGQVASLTLDENMHIFVPRFVLTLAPQPFQKRSHVYAKTYVHMLLYI